MPNPIPTHLILGFLGVGKTTAVLDLLRRKPASEKWAVLVNEYGQVSIDEAFIEGETVAEGVAVRSVAGGCFCCTTSPQLPVALHFLLQEAKPDRLLIETSGLGHPAQLLDNLRANYSERLEVKATVGIVSPIDFACPGMLENPVFRDQIQMADLLILNKSDRATPGVLAEFQSWAEGLFPPKLLVAATTQGQLDPAWLELDGDSERVPLFPDAHEANAEEELQTLGRPLPGKPVRYGSPRASGWIFSPRDVFDEERLLAFLGSDPAVTRLKGVFRVEEAWLAINRSGTATGVKPSAYRRDSRVEVFGEGIDWGTFEAGLLRCLVSRTPPVADSKPRGSGFQIGDRVVRNPETWKINAFDSWGRGEGIGVIVEPPFDVEEIGDVDVRWPGGRCFEEKSGLLPAPDHDEDADDA